LADGVGLLVDCFSSLVLVDIAGLLLVLVVGTVGWYLMVDCRSVGAVG
jgi:hypothetical protein